MAELVKEVAKTIDREEGRGSVAIALGWSMSKSEAEKTMEERGIFERFAADAGLTVVVASITQPDPPDILCEIGGFGQVAFELVQLDARQELARMGDFLNIRELWTQATESMTPDTRQRHRGAQINVEFDGNINQRGRRAALAQIATRLADLPQGAEGGLFEALPTGLASAELRHFTMDDGPRINEVSASGAAAVDLGRIDAKIAHYGEGWGVRGELLAYARWGMPFSDQQHDAAGYLSGRFPAGVFSRAWIYEVTSRRIIARAP
jgi:hypothetical protein